MFTPQVAVLHLGTCGRCCYERLTKPGWRHRQNWSGVCAACGPVPFDPYRRLLIETAKRKYRMAKIVMRVTGCNIGNQYATARDSAVVGTFLSAQALIEVAVKKLTRMDLKVNGPSHYLLKSKGQTNGSRLIQGRACGMDAKLVCSVAPLCALKNLNRHGGHSRRLDGVVARCPPYSEKRSTCDVDCNRSVCFYQGISNPLKGVRILLQYCISQRRGLLHV